MLSEVSPSRRPETKVEYAEMTVKLDTTMKAFEKDGGDKNFIEKVTRHLKIDRKLMTITSKRNGSVIITFRVQKDG